MRISTKSETSAFVHLEGDEKFVHKNDQGFSFKVDAVSVSVLGGESIVDQMVGLSGRLIRADGTVGYNNRYAHTPFGNLPNYIAQALLADFVQARKTHGSIVDEYKDMTKVNT